MGGMAIWDGAHIFRRIYFVSRAQTINMSFKELFQAVGPFSLYRQGKGISYYLISPVIKDYEAYCVFVREFAVGDESTNSD